MFVLAFAFAEGTGNDWIGVAVIDGYHAPPVVGTLTFAAFLAAMTVGPLVRAGAARPARAGARRAGPRGARSGRAAVFVFGGSSAAALGGAVLWGAGVSLGFPVGMSAGADDPARRPPGSA